MPATDTRPPADAPAPPLRVVGIGASAGGLQPLIEFLQACPLGQGLALVVVQHLAHAQHSSLAAVLQGHGMWPVDTAADGQPLRADHVWVIAPGTDLRVAGGALRVVPAQAAHGGARQVDILLQSLAADFGARAVGVVLSGMGDDGAAGLRDIVAHGGLALVQAPATAAFDAMPRAAAAASPTARSCEVAQMPDWILAVGPAATAGPADLAVADAAASDALALQAALRHLAGTTRHDFALYKPSTLRRRIDRRRALHGCATLADYLRLLQESTQETELLFKELLIGVTAFFRDPELWDAVRERVIPDLVAQAQRRDPPELRLWVVGCSTGEEAYTLAMLVAEALDALPGSGPLDLKIFATDLNPDAIRLARAGLYPTAALAGLSAARRARFFEPELGRWRVAPALREKLLFAQHDVTSDPPFSRLDLVSCRNLLIYFRPELQQRVLPLLHYVLRPGGVLLLGNAETLGSHESLFEPLDAKLRVYRRKPAAQRRGMAPFPTGAATRSRRSSLAMTAPAPTQAPATPSATLPGDSAAPAAAPALLHALVDRLMVEELAPPAVLVNEAGDILYVCGRTGRYLEPAAGKANWNLHAMAREGLRAGLAAALRELRHAEPAARRPLTLRGLSPDADDRGPRVDIEVRPVRWPATGELALIVFRDAAAPPRRRRKTAAGSEDARALQGARDEVLALREEMRRSEEELQASNEEMQSTNEELQSANEELTTSKEEMQAMNEELQTVNAELGARLDDLSMAQSDLSNLLNSTQIATLFLDGAMNVRRFTEQAKRVISLRDSDVGRPLSDLTSALDYPGLLDDVAEVLRTLEYRERAIRTTDGRWFSVRIMPYRTKANVIDGSVITFVDISVAKALEEQLRSSAR